MRRINLQQNQRLLTSSPTVLQKAPMANMRAFSAIDRGAHAPSRALSMNRHSVSPTFQSACRAGWKTGVTRRSRFMAPMRVQSWRSKLPRQQSLAFAPVAPIRANSWLNCGIETAGLITEMNPSP